MAERKPFPWGALVLGMLIWDCFFLGRLFRLFEITDFASFYAAGQAWIQGTNLYGSKLINLNPPLATVLFVPFALMPEKLAVTLWMIINLGALVYAVRIICKELDVHFSVQALLFIGLCMPTLNVLHEGNLPWLLTVPATLAWRGARNNRWLTAGLWIGLVVSIKPIFFWFGLYFLIRGQWKALGGAVISGSLSLLAGLMFGVQAYSSWLAALSQVNWGRSTWNGTIRSVILIFGLSPAWIWIAALAVIVVSFWQLRYSRKVDRDWSIVWLMSLLVSPLGWMYYLWLAAGPLVATFRQSRSKIFATAVITLCIPMPTIVDNLGQAGIYSPLITIVAPLGAYVIIVLWLLALRPSKTVVVVTSEVSSAISLAKAS